MKAATALPVVVALKSPPQGDAAQVLGLDRGDPKPLAAHHPLHQPLVFGQGLGNPSLCKPGHGLSTQTGLFQDGEMG